MLRSFCCISFAASFNGRFKAVRSHALKVFTLGVVHKGRKFLDITESLAQKMLYVEL